MKIRNTFFDFDKHTYVMGILNATPDSFSDGGLHFKLSDALLHAARMEEEGATIIDVGGESTRPGFAPVSVEEELARVIPVIEGIRAQSDIVISVDTTKSEVAKAALEAGADIINDVSGFLLDERMAEIACRYNCPCVLMHDGNYFEPDTEAVYIDKFLKEIGQIADKAVNAGVNPNNIILDPGVGFGKSLRENLLVIKDVGKLRKLGYHVLLGCSRKSVIGKSLDLPSNERVEGTITTSIVGALGGCGIVRVHDVKENLRAIKMYEAIRDVE